jgi:nucleolar pre-ribosomal-associated protein 1
LDREEIEATSGKSIAEMTSAFLEQVTATPGKGICFQDEGWYPRTPKDRLLSMNAEVEEDLRGSREERIRKGLHNRILSNVVRKLGSKVVDGKGRRGDWVLKVMRACPEIVAG